MTDLKRTGRFATRSFYHISSRYSDVIAPLTKPGNRSKGHNWPFSPPSRSQNSSVLRTESTDSDRCGRIKRIGSNSIIQLSVECAKDEGRL